MALAQVLTAVRELILDEREYPEDEAARKLYLEKRYPGLSEAEREDLAKITPERLRLYTVSIYAGERNVLRSKFPISFELISRIHEERGIDFDSYEFISEIHAKRPWRSAQIADLVANFPAYIRSDRADLLSARAGLDEVLTLEEITFGVPRAKSDKIAPKESLLLEQREDLSLDAILELQGFVPGYVRVAAFEYRCPELFRHMRQHETLPAGDVPEYGQSFGIVSRTAEYAVRWNSVSPESFRAFSALPRSELFQISDFAEQFLGSSPAGRSEEESARIFLADLVLLNSSGAVLIPK